MSIIISLSCDRSAGGWQGLKTTKHSACGVCVLFGRMAAVVFTWVLLQAVLLADILCSPVKNGFASKEGVSPGRGVYNTQAFYPHEEQVDSGYDSTGYAAPHPPGASQDYPSPPGSSKDVAWAIAPSALSGGPSTSDVSPPSGPEFVPGELRRIEHTLEDGGFESETQERGPPPSPGYASSPGPAAFMPMGSVGYFYPYDWMLITGQYPPGTYTHSSSSVELGRDDWQENHFLGYEYPSSPQKHVPTYQSASDWSYQAPGLADASGPQKQHWDTGKETSYWPI